MPPRESRRIAVNSSVSDSDGIGNALSRIQKGADQAQALAGQGFINSTARRVSLPIMAYTCHRQSPSIVS